MKRLQRKIPQVNWPSGKCKCKSQADATLTIHQNGLKKGKKEAKDASVGEGGGFVGENIDRYSRSGKLSVSARNAHVCLPKGTCWSVHSSTPAALCNYPRLATTHISTAGWLDK